MTFKKDYIYHLAGIKKVISTMANKNESPSVVFLTSVGQFQGEIFHTEEIDASSEESVSKSIENLIEQGKNVDVFSLTEAYYLYSASREQEEYNINEAIEDYAIPLKNVKIRNLDGSFTELEALVLFSDQIIGIIPGVFDKQ